MKAAVAAAQKPENLPKDLILGPLGWIKPNDDSANYHCEYQGEAYVYDIAADAFGRWSQAAN